MLKRTKLEMAKEIIRLSRTAGELEVKAADMLKSALEDENISIDASVTEANYLLMEAQFVRRELMDALNNWEFRKGKPEVIDEDPDEDESA